MWETWVQSRPLIPPLSAAASMADPPFALNYNSTGGWTFRRKGKTDREEGERERGRGISVVPINHSEMLYGLEVRRIPNMGFVNHDSTHFPKIWKV